MADAAQQEPSMEDILASIRRILSEDEAPPPPAAPAAAPPPPAAPAAKEWGAPAKDGAPGAAAKEWGTKPPDAPGAGAKEMMGDKAAAPGGGVQENKSAAAADSGQAAQAWAEKAPEGPGAEAKAWSEKPPEGPGADAKEWAEKPVEAPGAGQEAWADKPVEAPGGKKEPWQEKPEEGPGAGQEAWKDKAGAAGQGKEWDRDEGKRRPLAEQEDVLVLSEDMIADDDELQLAEPGAGGLRSQGMDRMDNSGSLLAGGAQGAATSALAQLKRAVAQTSHSMASDRNLALGNGGITIEQLTREILNDLLKDWLNQHLPPMVDRIVKKEIQKLVAQAD
jgi:cell pole-organizing protein PopZ